MTAKWTFAKNDGGQMCGLNNAGVETFKGNFDRYLAREIIQNSLDAIADPNKPVEVRFQKESVPRGDVPDMDFLRDTLQRCAEFWTWDKKASSFLERAIQLASAREIVTLHVSDYNTEGVCGGDRDHHKGWFHLVRCAGSSSKLEGEGGSFGIGKNAPFAASMLRTIFYSTLNKDAEHIFAGVATLVSHELTDKSMAQAVGFLGGEKGASIRDGLAIPKRFMRREQGTDLVILGFPDEEEWERDLVYSILDNFWPAIEFGILEVWVGETFINKESLPSLLRFYSEKGDDFSAHLYYNAFKRPLHHHSETLKDLGACDLYILADDSALPKRVAMIRKTGMVIFQKPFRSIIPFCGVFLCRNEKGNMKLREMEPPRHDIWDRDHPEKGANRKIENEYVGFIRGKLRDLAPVDPTKVIAVPGLNKYLPDDEDSDEQPFDGSADESKGESAEPATPPPPMPVRVIPRDRRMPQPDSARPILGEDETDIPGDGQGANGVPEGTPKDRTPNPHPNPDNPNPGGGAESSDATKTAGSKGGVHSKPSVPIRFRSFSTNPEAGMYTVSITSEAEVQKKVILSFSAVGDDQREAASLKWARLSPSELLTLEKGHLVGPVLLAPGKTLRIEVALVRPGRIAMEVIGHEA